MTNLDRLKRELGNTDGFQDEELTMYLEENSLEGLSDYDTKSRTNRRNILKTTMSILESVANNPTLMRAYKTEDISIFQFHDNLMDRIESLRRKINLMADDEEIYQDGATFVYLFDR